MKQRQTKGLALFHVNHMAAVQVFMESKNSEFDFV